MHGILCKLGLEIGGYTEAIYNQSKQEQIRVLALAKGPWKESELVPIRVLKGIPGVIFESDDAHSRAIQLFTEQHVSE